MGTEIIPGETIPAETGVTAVAVNFTKGCYPGQELVERMDSRGATPPRQLRVLDVGPGVAVGDPILDAVRRRGRHLTSVAAGKALGYVRRGAALTSEVRATRTDIRTRGSAVRPERLLGRALVDGRASPRAVDRGSTPGSARRGRTPGRRSPAPHLVARRAGVDRLAEPRRRRGGVAERRRGAGDAAGRQRRPGARRSDAAAYSAASWALP